MTRGRGREAGTCIPKYSPVLLSLPFTLLGLKGAGEDMGSDLHAKVCCWSQWRTWDLGMRVIQHKQ